MSPCHLAAFSRALYRVGLALRANLVASCLSGRDSTTCCPSTAFRELRSREGAALESTIQRLELRTPYFSYPLRLSVTLKEGRHPCAKGETEGNKDGLRQPLPEVDPPDGHID